MPPSSAYLRIGGAGRGRGFTLIELLVVFAIILVLLSSIFVGATALLTKSKSRAGLAQLAVVQAAIDEFKREQTESPTIIRAKQNGTAGKQVRYKNRYGAYPPDELEIFTAVGLPGSAAPPANRSLAVGGVTVVPAPTGSGYAPMKFYTTGNTKPELEHRDLAAMLIAIEMYSPSAQAILERLPAKQWSTGAQDAAGNPAQFLDDDGNGTWTPGTDTQVRYIIDPWDVPLSYIAQRDWDPAKPNVSSNHPDWQQAATEMVRLNGNQPIIMSYGPDGRDQLTKDVLEADPTASLVSDWVAAEPGAVRINNPLNADNLYADPTFADKLRSAVSPPP